MRSYGFHGVEHCCVVLLPEATRDFGQRAIGHKSGQVHSRLTRAHDVTSAALRFRSLTLPGPKSSRLEI